MSIRRANTFKGWPLVVSLILGGLEASVLFPVVDHGLAQPFLWIILAAPWVVLIEICLRVRREKNHRKREADNAASSKAHPPIP